jgi:hypothetical protein
MKGVKHMTKTCNNHIRKALEAVKTLMVLADEGEAASTDDGCVVLYSVVRDCAYKIRAEAERERDAHKARGQWEKIGHVVNG